jgi:3-oxoacyl-[acyl-carrier-protein] synthase II
VNDVNDAIVVTGIGAVGPFGVGVDAMAAALARGLPCDAPLSSASIAHRRSRALRVGRCPPAASTELVPSKLARRMSLVSRFAVGASQLALRDADAVVDAPALVDAPPTAVGFATSFGASSFTERLMIEILDLGPELASPYLFTDCVANAPAGQVAIATGARAANATFTQREAGSLVALRWAVRELRRGRAERALVGAVDEMPPLVHGFLDRLRALARATTDVDEAPRPFDRRRNGYLAAEGAQVLVLERESAARARGVRPQARVVAVRSGFDPTASAFGFGADAAGLGGLVRELLDDAGLRPHDIDAVVSGANGSIFGDRVEAEILRTAFDVRVPPTFAPKAVIGEHAGGTLVPAVLVLAGATLVRPHACTTPDAELGVTLHDGALPEPPRRVLTTAVAPGGTFACALLEAVR